ncbi:MAG: recombination protein RecR [Bacilli bacterium]|nr:recombination protein RecR [Bacilli bacterium]
MYPESIKNLIESFKTLPGIGEKTAERLAFSILELEEDQIKLFSESLLSVKEKIKHCKKCNTLTEDDLCFICSDNSRSNDLLCVVEDTKNVFLFEKMGVFSGKYHVLDGLISPLDGINPEDIGLNKLIDRIKEEKFKEIIFAFKPSIEGETTALYIKKILDGMGIKVTRLASGVPIGADMEYVDSLTLERALNDRKELE